METVLTMSHISGPRGATEAQTPAVHAQPGQPAAARSPREPTRTLAGCDRIVVVGRTGSGKTTLARELAAVLGVPHVELDALYFGPEFSTAPLDILRERTSSAIAGEQWVTDGNKRAVRDLVWPRADTIIWLDYSLAVSLWRLGRRARRRTAQLSAEAARTGRRGALPRQLLAAARGVLTALRSHAGQRREFARAFSDPANSHLAVAHLRSPRATQEWLTRVRTAAVTPLPVKPA